MAPKAMSPPDGSATCLASSLQVLGEEGLSLKVVLLSLGTPPPPFNCYGLTFAT